MGSVGKALLALLLFLAACSTRLPVTGVDAYQRHDYATAIAVFKAKAQNPNDKNYVLYNLAILSAAMAAGDYETAQKAALEAQKMMWSDVGAGRGQASLISAEALKVFKGEPFEKAMASVYSGIIFFNQGDLDNARAAFAKALLAIKQKEPPHQEDFALAYALQAYVLLKLKDEDNARISLEKAQKAESKNLYLVPEQLRKSNALILVELGRAPRKLRTGPGASLIKWERSRYPERSVEVFVDDKGEGWAARAGDLTEQAQTKGKVAKDTVQVVKGATREAGAVTTVIAADLAAQGVKNAGWVALGAGLFTALNQSQADVRQWELLPDLIQLLPLRLPEGTHSLRLVFFDESGNPIPGYDQTLSDVAVEKGKDRIYLFRSGAYTKGPGKY
ncbi:MAG: tetratricopeptide repeat protein [Pseudomonadota bacterium]